ncbi:unnamed protein product [Rhizophagus irregularis]|nr:unnamed protein product [Rhizophagus irregularis]
MINQRKNNNSNSRDQRGPAVQKEKRKVAANSSSSDTSNDMNEDFAANTAAADMGLELFTSQPIVFIPAGPSSLQMVKTIGKDESTLQKTMPPVLMVPTLKLAEDLHAIQITDIPFFTRTSILKFSKFELSLIMPTPSDVLILYLRFS